MSNYTDHPTPPEVRDFQRQWPSLSADLRPVRRVDWARALVWGGFVLATLAFWGTVVLLVVRWVLP